MCIFINKNYLFHLTGCAVFLLVGARMQNAKADWPSAECMESYWKSHPKIFCETFEKLFSNGCDLNLLSSGVSCKDYEEKYGGIYTVKHGSDSYKVHCVSDLFDVLPECYPRGILKTLGSSEFLKAVLLDDTVGALCTDAEKYPINITFTLGSDFCEKNGERDFFDEYGRATIKMEIKQRIINGKKPSRAVLLQFAFKKEKGSVRMTGENACFSSNGISVNLVRQEKPKIEDFPYDDIRSVIENLPTVFKEMQSWGIYETMDDVVYNGLRYPEIKEKREALDVTKTILKSPRFFESIFGKKLWDIFQRAYRYTLYNGLEIEYYVENGKCKDDREFCLVLKNFCVFPEGTLITFSGDVTQNAFNSIELCFCYHIGENRIDNVRFWKVILNGETLVKDGKRL